MTLVNGKLECVSSPSAHQGVRSRRHEDALVVRRRPIDIDKDERDVPVDIFEEGNKMRVIAELPGVNEEDVRLDLSEDILVISASRGNRSYYKNVKLPRASENIIGKSYNNGILEVILN